MQRQRTIRCEQGAPYVSVVGHIFGRGSCIFIRQNCLEGWDPRSRVTEFQIFVSKSAFIAFLVQKELEIQLET